MQFRWSTLFLFAAIFIGGFLVWLGRVDNPDNLFGEVAPRSGAAAPDFTLVDLGNESHTLSDYEGQAVIINFWATWCGPCRAEMPALEAVYNKYRDDGLVLLAVNQAESPTTIQNFVDEHRLTFPILLDPNFGVSRSYEVQAYPSTYFIDRQGRIINATFSGPMTESFIESQVLRILN